jgi:2,4-dienoyl-CoA reductase-like NADH-dependent reductase (Old Yellow Enzyme family)
MATAKAEADGNVSEDILKYYKDKSQGGYISLIIIEHSYISEQGKAHKNQLSISNDSNIDGLRKLSAVIHKNGSKAVMQLNHAGSAAKEEVTGTKPVGPSAIAHPNQSEMPNELTKQEIKEVVNAFQAAAIRVKEAGFDGVEIHSAHGYLLSQFLSPLTNKRNDEYGGSVFNRFKLHLRVIEAVRSAVGDAFPILLRLGAADFMEGGLTIEDSQVAASAFEKAGVDILDISGGFCGFNMPGASDQGYFAPLTEAIKKVVSIPVILTGGITEAKAAQQLLANSKADLIGVGRAIFKDSNWARKAIESCS